MAENTFQIFKTTDEELLKTFEQICEQMGGNGQYVLSFAVGQDQPPQLQLSSEQLQSNELVQEIRAAKAFIFAQVQVTFPSLPGASLIVTRYDGFDQAKLGLSRKVSHEHAARVSLVVHKHLKAVAATPSIEKILGEEVAEFYRKREEGLLRLEGLSQRLIEDNETYRRTLDREHGDLKKQLRDQLAADRDALSKENEKKRQALDERDKALEARIKDLDDRDSRHVRRQIRQDLKGALAERSKTFGLTKGTVRKRLSIHGLFMALLLFTGAMAVLGFMGLTSLSTAETVSDRWYLVLRFSVAAVGFAAAVIYYIRWNNHWFQRHAEEEFSLKRLDLDMDRASWVVEMALEWAEEKGSELPPELVERLTRNLFPGEEKRKSVRHPSEDLAAALLAASSGLRIQTAVGDFTLDKKGLRKLRRAAASEQGGAAGEESS